MTADDLERRAIIAAHRAACGPQCDGYPPGSDLDRLNEREQAIVEAWRADVDGYRCICLPEPDEAVTGQCPIHGDMSAQAQGRRDYDHMAKLRQEAADRAEKAEAAIERALVIWREHTNTALVIWREHTNTALVEHCKCIACDMARALDETETTDG